MSENNKIKQLENKVELLSRIVLENDFCQKELCVMALKNGWSADIPDKITALMQKFSEKQTFKCREFETAFDEIGDNLSNSIGSVIDCFYRCNVFIRVLFIYLESYFKEKKLNPQTTFCPPYDTIYNDLKYRYSSNSSLNPYYVTPYPHYSGDRYAMKKKNQSLHD